MIDTTTGWRGASAAGDLGSRRITGFFRVLMALVVAAAASVQALPLPAWFAWVAGLVWLPAAVGLWMAEEGPASRRRTLIGMTMDLAALLTVIALAPELAPTVLLLLVPLAAAYTYQGGPADGVMLAAVALSGRWLLALTGPPGDVGVVEETTGALVTLSVILLMQRALRVRRRDARRVREFAAASETIMDRSTESILITLPGGEILQSNPAATRVLLHPEDAPLVGSTCGERLALHDAGGHPLDCSTGCALAAMCGGGDDAVEVWRHIAGDRQPLLASAVPLRAEDGRKTFLHSFRDITALKQADEAKTMFLATASHELKTPLTVIRGFAQLLQQRVEDEQSRVALQAIEARSGELAVIVDRLLLSSRIDAGQVELTLDDIDLSQLLTTRLRDLGRSLGTTVDVDVDLPDGLLVHANLDGLATVIEHLVDNGAKYSHGVGAVAVHAHVVGDRVHIDVSDDGIGMTPDQVEHCFDKFWQAEVTDVRRFGGTGIGLYIVKSLVTSMGGSVSVRSRRGHGSTFTVEVASASARTGAMDEQAGPPPDAAVEPDGHTLTQEAADTMVDEMMQQIGLRAGPR